MKKKTVALAVTGIAVYCLAVFGYFSTVQPAQHDTSARAGVRIGVDGGHGSGVHLGGGLFITAAHVVADTVIITLKTENGEESPATVLWANKAYDVALVRAYKPLNVRAAPLVCEDPPVGTALQTTGNPGSLEFVRTWGRVASMPQPPNNTWLKTIVADMTVMGGVSGAPVYDDNQRLRGIVVGGMLQHLGDSPSIIALTYVVPGSVICTLLGRVS